MNRSFRSCFAVSLLLAMSAPSFARTPSGSLEGTDLKIKVYVYNYAQVPSPVLVQARQQVENIYRAADVEAEWVDCSVLDGESHKYPACRHDGSGQDWVAIRIISRSQMSVLQLGADKMGLAMVPDDGAFGRLAFVCSECAEPLLGEGQFRESRKYAFGSILGALMVHEIGHLVLATLRHSGAGLMYSPWNRGDLKHAVQGRLVFTAKEAQRIRDRVRDRMRAEHADQAGF